MALFDLLGTGLTLLTLALLAAGGYLAAVRILGRRALEDPLELALAWLLAATAEGVGLALLAGSLGLLRIDVCLALQALLTLALARWPRRLTAEEQAGPLRHLAARAWARACEIPALVLVALHAVGYETLRGVLRPPLSWDSLMYHLLLTATWLQERNLKPVFGPNPVSYYGYAPANGSVWVWWWMAPSHSELWAGLAFLPQWLLLGLAAGALARHLGARRQWPVAALLAVTAPVVVRFVATQYVDIFLAACLLAACAFGLRWLHEPGWGDALLAGLGLGLAAGTKVIGIPYGAALAAVLVAVLMVTARGTWRRRVPHLGLALAAALALGGFFYLRNVTLGVDPLALSCESAPRREDPHLVPKLPRRNSILDLPDEMFRQGQLVQTLLGVTAPPSQEMGLGPQAFLVLLGLAALPFLARRREGLVLFSQAAAELAFWLTVPFAAQGHIFANTRYLLPCFGIGFAAVVALAETRGLRESWLRNVALVLLAQDLLLLGASMAPGVRLWIALADLAAFALLLLPGLRGRLRAHPRALAAAGACCLLLGSPFLASFRRADRARALASEYQVHSLPVPLYAGAWDWLDRQGGDGTVAVMAMPEPLFIYPAMGPYLERKAIYVNVNAENVREAAAYPRCQPRTGFDPEAWLANLRRADARWLLVSRTPSAPFPMEREWANARPDLFKLRYSDAMNEIYELEGTSPVGTP